MHRACSARAIEAAGHVSEFFILYSDVIRITLAVVMAWLAMDVADRALDLFWKEEGNDKDRT
jgi:hypothetical protein